MLSLITTLLLHQMCVFDEGIKQGCNSSSVNCLGGGITCSYINGRWQINVPIQDGGAVSLPVCTAGQALSSDAGVLYCISNVSTATALAANPADCSANQYATTIAANGDLTCSQVSYSQLSGSPLAGGSSPQVQYNNSGVLAGASKVESDGTRLQIIPETAVPASVATKGLHLDYQLDSGFPVVPVVIDGILTIPVPVGIFGGGIFATVGQSATWLAQCHTFDGWLSATWLNLGETSNPTQTTGSTNTDAWAVTSWKTRQRMLGFTSATANNSTAAVRLNFSHSWRGNASGAGGFATFIRAYISSAVAGQRAFFGLATATGEFTSTTEPSAQTDTVYFGCDGGQTTLHICSNDNVSTATCSDLGSNFPCTTNGAGYDFWVSAPPNVGYINYYINRLDASFTASGQIASDLPRNTVQLSAHSYMNNGASASSTSVRQDLAIICSWDNW